MNNEQQAKNGFKTFVVTLSVSLVIFCALYYLITGFSNEINIEDSTASSGVGNTTVVYKPNEVAESEDVKGATTQASVFNEIAQAPVGGQAATVLSEHDETVETTESTVPETGSETMLGVIMTVAAFSAVAYFLLIGPRNLALSGFEKEITRE